MLEQGGVICRASNDGPPSRPHGLAGSGAGPASLGAAGVAVGATGPIYINDFTAGSESQGPFSRWIGHRPAFPRQRLRSGERPRAMNYGLAVDAAGRPVVTVNRYDPPSSTNFLVRVNPHNGHRVIVSDFQNPTQGEMCSSEDISQDNCFIVGLTLQHARKIFVATIVYSEVPGQSTSKIFRVNAVTGERILVTDFGNPAQGAEAGISQGGSWR